jgi:osmotically-inducible protein OsmY
MHTVKMKPLIAACALAIGMTCTAAIAKDNDQSSDVWAKAAITTTYTLNRHLNPFKIDVDVNNGVATLNGSVESDVERDLAEELAKGVDGVKEVRNELKVDDEATMRTDSDSFMNSVRDANITAQVKSQLLWNSNTHGLKIDVDTKKSVVTLTGKVESTAESDLAEQIAGNTSDVVKVNNNLEVEKNTANLADKAEREAKEAKVEVSDSWITTKVKSALAYNRNIEMDEIDVTTTNGIVMLKGTVESETSKRQATEIAKGIRGVKSVNADIKVTPRHS